MVVPDMTAHWESQLEAISDKRMSYGQFMQPLTEGLRALIGEVEIQNFTELKGLGKKPAYRRKKQPKKPHSM